jgi:trehalose-phosphatase
MKYLFEDWEETKKTITGKNIFLFLDYDGTLSSIADHPDKAFLSDEVKDILHKVIRNPRFKVAVISGRSLRDIKNRVHIGGITYSGNHGLEINSPTFKFKNNISSSYKKLLSKIKKELRKAFKDFKGVLIQDKKLTLSVHYRLADKKNILRITRIFHKMIAGYLNEKKIKIIKGKMVLEIAPPIKWNKGLAVSWILNRPEFSKNNFFPLYFGDDTTDEDAFRLLKDRGITVFVGRPTKSSAQFYLNNVSEVIQFIEQL